MDEIKRELIKIFLKEIWNKILLLEKELEVLKNENIELYIKLKLILWDNNNLQKTLDKLID